MGSVIAISAGAAAGALSRWGLSVWLNALFPPLPLGTLSSNLLGGYLIGMAMAVFSSSGLAPERRLLIVTGFLGGLTTFSTFSAEVFSHLQAQRYGWAAATGMAHVLGSLLATFLGYATYTALTHR